MNILLLTSRPEIAERLRRQFTIVNWTDFALHVNNYADFDAVLIVESIDCRFYDEEQQALGGVYISVFKAWKNFLAEIAPAVKLLVAGFCEVRHPNYLPLHLLPGHFDLKATIDAALSNDEPWQASVPVAGEDVLMRLHLFYEGHHRDGIVMNLAKVRQCLNYAYYSPDSHEPEGFKTLWQHTLHPEINSARGLNARWANYAPYFRWLPFYQQLEEAGITDFMAELNKVFSGPVRLSDKMALHKQQAFIQFDGFNRLHRIQLELDAILRRFVNPEIIGAMLVIDDDRRFHEQLKADFPDFNISHIYTAHEIAEAIARPYDIVLLDLQLDPLSSSLTGLDHIARIKHAQPEAALIVVTTHSKPGIIQDALKNGADYCLRKQDFDLHEWHSLFLRAAAGKLDTANMPRERLPEQEESAKILIITEEDNTFHLLQTLQHKQAYQFTRALTPQQALDIVRENGDYFELILLDFANGNEVTTAENLELMVQLKALIPETPVIAMFNTSHTQASVFAIESGASDYLEKDRYEPKLWQNRYNQYIELKRLRRVVNKFKMS